MRDVEDKLPDALGAMYYGDRSRQRYYDAFGTYDGCPVIDKVYLNEKPKGDFVTGSFPFGIGRQWLLHNDRLCPLDRANAPFFESATSILVVEYYREECKVLVREIYGGLIIIAKVMNIGFNINDLTLVEDHVIVAENRHCGIYGISSRFES